MKSVKQAKNHNIVTVRRNMEQETVGKSPMKEGEKDITMVFEFVQTNWQTVDTGPVKSFIEK